MKKKVYQQEEEVVLETWTRRGNLLQDSLTTEKIFYKLRREARFSYVLY
jgi:hypothetical protein